MNDGEFAFAKHFEALDILEGDAVLYCYLSIDFYLSLSIYLYAYIHITTYLAAVLSAVDDGEGSG